MNDVEFESEFLRGQNDCMSGIGHKKGESDAYTRGYSAQYALEQAQSALSE